MATRSQTKIRIIPIAILIVSLLWLWFPGAKMQAATSEATYTVIHSGAIEPMDSFVLKVTLKNVSGSDITNAEVVLDSNSSFFATNSNGLIQPIPGTWTNSSTTDVNFSLIYDGGSRTGISLSLRDATTKISYDFSSTYTIAVTTSDSNTSTTVVDTSTYVPAIDIVSDPYITASAGDTLTIALKIKNTSSYSAQNIRIIPDLSGDCPFSLNGTSSQFTLANLNPGETQTLSGYYLVSASAVEKVYTLKFNFTYNNAYGNHFGSSSSPLSQSIYVNVKNNNTFPQINLGNIRVTNPDKAQQSVMKTVLKVSNSGSLTAKDICITLQGLKDDGLGLYQDSNIKSISSLSGKSSADITYYLIPSAKLSKGNYALTAKIDYKDESGKAYTGDYQFFVPVQDGGGSAVIPKIILNSYSCDPGIVKAGEKFKLRLSFLNTSKEKTVKNIKIYLTVPDGGQSTNSSGSVFTPVNSSNTLFIDEIQPKSLAVKTLEFYTIPDASPKTYSLTANFEYQDEQGTEYKATEIIGVPVNQQVALETTDFQLASDGFIGQPVPISMQFYNTGKATISNLMLKVEGNFSAENGTYYVGTFEVGASDYFEATITPTTPGLQSGSVIITFDDPSGEHLEIKKEISFNAQEMVQPQPTDGMIPVEMTPPVNWKKRLIIIGAVLVLVIIGSIIAHKRGLFKKLKKRLTLPKFQSKQKGQTPDE